MPKDFTTITVKISKFISNATDGGSIVLMLQAAGIDVTFDDFVNSKRSKKDFLHGSLIQQYRKGNIPALKKLAELLLVKEYFREGEYSYTYDSKEAKKISNDMKMYLGKEKQKKPMTEKEYRDILFDIVAPHKGLEIVSKKLFRDGHFEAALGEASKFLENYIQDKIEDKSKTGVELMSLAFNKEKPLLSLYEGSLDAKQKNEQDGFHALCRGEVQFIKNRCSHNKTGSIASDMNDCLRLLGTINYLLDCVDKMYSDKQEEDIDFDDIPF